MDDETHVLETETQEEEVVETEVDTNEEEDVEAIKAELEKEKAAKAELEKKNKQLYERIKKGEKGEGESLNVKDILALKDAEVTAEDLDEVQDFAKYRKISIAEALQSKTLKTILAERKEERRTAQATETKSPRGIAKVTGEDILRKAEATGEVPDSIDGIKSMLEARLARRKK